MEQGYTATMQPPATNTRLNRRWLIPARVLWLIITFIALGLFAAGLLLRYEDEYNSYRGDIQAQLRLNHKGEIIISPYWLGAAMHAGILESDVLLVVNDLVVTSLEQAEELLVGEIGSSVNIQVRTGNFPARQLTVTRGGELGQLLREFGLTGGFAVGYIMASEILFAIICAAIGFIIFWRRSDDWMALLASLAFITLLLGLSAPVIILRENIAGTRYLFLWDLWISYALGLLPVFFYLFPSGQFVPRLTIYLTGIIILWTILEIFYPSLYPWHMTRLTSVLILLPMLGTGVFALIYRYRYRSDATQRRQIRWIVWGALAAILGLAVQILNETDFFGSSYLSYVLSDFVIYPFGQALKLLLPVSVVFAIRRYHLWDIHILINRALVYGALTASVIGIYVLTVGALGTVMQSNVNWLVSILATGLIAVLVQPLRDRLQRGVNRMMYGERDDPITVLSRLGQQLETALAPDAVLPSLVKTVAQRLKLPYVAIEVPSGQSTVISAQWPVLDHLPITDYPSSQSIPVGLIAFPLVYQSETIGQLLVAPRASGEVFSPMDRHLLENIARQAGMAVHAVSLTNELQQAHQRLVTAVEEERRRLRRDLHDGLGPALASQGLKLAAAKQLLRRDPDSVESLLDQVMMQNQETVSDVRRLVYGLRPPVLDERGLAEAIRDHVLHTYNEGEGLYVEVGELPVDLQSLPAAVEVAAYRIALEALTNIIRHARAKHCTIRFIKNGNGHTNILQIEIVDNGIGLPRELRAGVGLRSMRERSEELGGTLTIEPMPRGGTRVTALLPLGDNANSRDFNQVPSADYP